MAITAAQQQRTEALHIDVEVKFYTALAADVTATDITQDSTFSPDGSWTEITAIATGQVRFAENWDEHQSIIDWRASVSGVSYNSTSLDRGRLMLAMHRLYSVASGWTSWTVWWCGYIESIASARDDHDQMGRWTASVRSLSFLLENDDAPAHNFGMSNIATVGTATASSTLTTVSSEGGKGEFSGLASVEASNVIDGNRDTVWISNLAPTFIPETPTQTGSDLCVNEVYREPTGYDAGYRWIEIYNRAGTEADANPGLWQIVSSTGTLNLHSLKDSYSIGYEKSLVLCANKSKFNSLFNAGATPVVDWRTIDAWSTGIAGSSWTYDPAGDYLYLIDSVNTACACVLFGTGVDPGVVGDVDVWTGAAVAAWTAGKSIHRQTGGNPSSGYEAGATGRATDWQEEDYPSPGLHSIGDASNWEWVSVDLGSYTWSLTAEITVASTTITVTPDTTGLKNAGQIMMDDDDDIITYTGKTSTTLTGVTGIDATHAATTQFDQYENSARTNYPKLGGMKWIRRWRPTSSSSADAVVPEQWAIWLSASDSPTYPPDENWELDWKQYSRNTGVFEQEAAYNWAWSCQFAKDAADTTRPRARHVLLMIQKMNDDGRAKLNELEVYADQRTAEADTYLDDIDADTLVEHLLVTHYGLAAAQVVATSSAEIGPFSTQKSDYVSVIGEICRQTGCILQFRRDLRVYVITDPLFAIPGSVDTQYTIDKQAATEIRPSFGWPNTIGQVELTARNAEAEETYNVVYPATANTGAVRRIYGEAIVGSLAQAQQFAEAHYKRARAANRVELSTSGITDEWCRPPVRVALTWDMDAAGTVVDFAGDLFLVTGIDVMLQPGHPVEYNETVQLVEWVA